VSEDVLDGYSQGAFENLSVTLSAFQEMARATEPELIVPRLPDVRCPVELLIGGAPHEGSLPAPELGALRAGLHQLRVVTIPNCGHFIAEERPDAILASIRRITRQSVASESADVSTSEGR
jgi:pimeloyl-ACP methyl ester carboxylesterase